MSGRTRRLGLIALACLGGVLVLVIGAWAIDSVTHSGQVMRNVSLAGTAVGGLSETELRAEVSRLGEATTARPVRVETPAGALDTDAMSMGLTIDQEATVEATLAAGRGTFVTRPFEWLGAMFTPHRVVPTYRVDPAKASSAIAALIDANQVPPTEPTILLVDGEIVPIPGVAGEGLHTVDVESHVTEAAEAGGDPLVVVLDTAPVQPRFTDADVQEVAERANALSATALTVTVADQATTIEPAVLRTWMRAVPATDGTRLVLGMDPDQIALDVTAAVGAVGTPPTELSWQVDGGGVRFVEGTPGTGCCAPDSPQRIIEALESGAGEVTLELTAVPPAHDAAWAQSLGIVEPIASFTTNHACCEGRVQNIQRMADLVRGAVVAPGETFSLNGHVGQRTRAKGFVEAGVIYNGRFETDVGGGVSQFTTTLFNAAFFGGMDFVEYQAHTIYISRYPYGREATLSFPAPDLKITNSSPYGILIWPTYSGTSITVTLYSTKTLTADQTGQSTAPAGRCTRVTTERTRTWLDDGHSEVDTVSALYQPSEGVLC